MITNLIKYGAYYISAAISTNSLLWFERPAGMLVARDDAEIIEAAQERCVVSSLTGTADPQWYSAWPLGSNSIAGTTPSVRTFAHAGNNTLLSLQGRDWQLNAAPAMWVWRTNGLVSGGAPATVAAPTLTTSTSGGVTTYTYDNAASTITEQTIATSTREGAGAILDAFGNVLRGYTDYHPIAYAIYDDLAPAIPPNPITCAVSLPINGVIWPNARPCHWVWEPSTNYYGGGPNVGDWTGNIYNRTPAVTNYNELAGVLRSLTTSVRVIRPQLTNITMQTKSFYFSTNEMAFNNDDAKYMSKWNTGATSNAVAVGYYPDLLTHDWAYQWVTSETAGGSTSYTISQTIRMMSGNITEVLDWPSVYALTNGYVARLRVYALVTATVSSPQATIDRAAPVGSYGGVEYTIAALPWTAGAWAISAPDETGVSEYNHTLTKEIMLTYANQGRYFTPHLNLVYDVINPSSATNRIITFAAQPGTPTQPPYATRNKRWTDGDGKRHGIAYRNCYYRLHLRQLVIVVDWNWHHKLATNN